VVQTNALQQDYLRKIVNGIKKGKTRNRVGLDIGNYSIKIIETSGPSEKPSLISFGTLNIAGSSNGIISASVKSLADELSISTKDVSISVSGPSLIVRLISMPKMTDEELAGAIRFETEKFIPFDISDCILDFQILNKAAKDKNSVDILLAAAKREHVLQRIKTVEEAGLSVKAVDADIFAVINSFLANHTSQEQPKTIAILNIGALSTALSILSGNVPVFVREIAAGGNDVSAAIAKKAGLSQELSEKLKLDPKEKMQEVAGFVRPALISILDEVKLSFGYYENQSGKGVDEIYVSGGGAAMAGIDEAFQESFGSKPRYWDPFRFLDKSSVSVDASSLEKVKNSFAVAVGLTLR
jgi:type IV pilus assembly protein PilM